MLKNPVLSLLIEDRIAHQPLFTAILERKAMIICAAGNFVTHLRGSEHGL
jgi:hypothetical protein